MTLEQVWEQARDFQESRAILTAAELDLFAAVGDGASGEAMAARLGTDPRATAMLLDALVSLGALRKQDGKYLNTPGSASVTGATRMAMLHTANLWHSWSTLTDCVRRGTSVREHGGDWVQPFIAAMHYNAAQSAAQAAAAADASKSRRMLDLGGGSGAFSIAFAQANPELVSDIFDLPPVVPLTSNYVQEAGLSDRIRTRFGDMLKDELPSGYDLVFLSSICHMFGEEDNRKLLAKAFRALDPGGRVVIRDFILNSDRTGPKPAALFALNMLVNTPGGNSYSEAEYAGWLREAGFAEVRHVPLPGPTGLMIGTK